MEEEQRQRVLRAGLLDDDEAGAERTDDEDADGDVNMFTGESNSKNSSS